MFAFIFPFLLEILDEIRKVPGLVVGWAFNVVDVPLVRAQTEVKEMFQQEYAKTLEHTRKVRTISNVLIRTAHCELSLNMMLNPRKIIPTNLPIRTIYSV